MWLIRNSDKDVYELGFVSGWLMYFIFGLDRKNNTRDREKVIEFCVQLQTHYLEIFNNGESI